MTRKKTPPPDRSKTIAFTGLAVFMMLCVHFFIVGGFDGPPQSGDDVGEEVVAITQPPASREEFIETAEALGAKEPYIYPLFAEYYPYDARAEDEDKVKILDVEGALELGKVNAYQYALKNTGTRKARIAIMIDDMGMNRVQSKAVIGLDDVPLTLAFLPYAPDIKAMTRASDEAGHELMIHMPMEPMNGKIDTGPIALMDGMDADALEEMLDKAYASFDGYVGLNNHMGSRLTQNKAAMDVVMKSIDKQGLFYVDSKTISTSVAADAARRQGLRHAERDVFLDHEENIGFVRAALQKTEKVALDKGYAIAIGHPKVNTVAGLREWIPTLEARGFEIVPVSDLLMVPQGARDVVVAKVDSAAAVSTQPKVRKEKPRKKSGFKAVLKEPNKPQFIFTEPDSPVADIEPAAGEEEAVFVATEDLLNAPIGNSSEIEAGIYSLSE